MLRRALIFSAWCVLGVLTTQLLVVLGDPSPVYHAAIFGGIVSALGALYDGHSDIAQVFALLAVATAVAFK